MIHLLKASALLCISIYSITAAANPPDTIFYNGKILTVDPQFSVAEAIAISDGRIVAVGSNAEILELTEGQTKQCDLEGHTVIPGLIDNHMHYMRGASRWRFEARIDGVTSRKKALNIIGQRAKEIEPGQWVFVLGGWNEQQFSDAPGGFTTEELDAAAPNNPVFIQKSYSKAYMNSLAEHELARSKNDSSRESGQQNNSSTTQRRSNRSSSGRSQAGRSSSRRSGGARTIINQATTYVPSRSESERVEDIVLFNSVLNSHGLTTVYDV
ncbi:MAG: amidohydrolase family protein, partial [Pirellulales bacterium]